jgi:alkylation response protein AidB-like acyl-CoA dehydrogenase
LEQRVAIRLSTLHAMRVGTEVVDAVFALAGGGSLYDASPLQRCWRDVHAASCHVFFSNNHQVHGGKVLLGQPADEWLM